MADVIGMHSPLLPLPSTPAELTMYFNYKVWKV